MRALTLVFVLVLAAAPVYANGYGTGAAPAPEAASETTAAPVETMEETTAPVEAMETTTPEVISESTETTTTTVTTSSAESSTAPVAATTTTTSTATMSSTQMDALAASTVARCYAMDPAMVAQLQAKGYTTSDIATLGNLSARTGRPVSEFVQLRDQRMSWSDIAGRYNVAMSDLMTPMAMMVSPEVDAYNRQFARQYFGLRDADITALRNQGMAWGEIYLAANVAARSSRPITEIAALRSQGVAWNDIGTRYNIALADLTRPFVPAGQVAGVTAMVGPITAPTNMISKDGRIILSLKDSERFRAMGYDWRSIAVAANISMRTRDSVQDILAMTNRGLTWPRIARSYALSPNEVVDVNYYPFRRDEPKGSMMMQPAPAMQPQGGGQVMPQSGTMSPPAGGTTY